ncbi:MAG: hypothetical protein LH614_09840 [Pyrinomonadaceae bacterium]|nr:hypothetical protein [Pyrinomonadaceae bacterium]
MHIQNIFKAGNFVLMFLAFFVFFSVAEGQTPTPENETIRVNTDLIQTNVTVVDKSNRAFARSIRR